MGDNSLTGTCTSVFVTVHLVSGSKAGDVPGEDVPGDSSVSDVEMCLFSKASGEVRYPKLPADAASGSEAASWCVILCL